MTGWETWLAHRLAGMRPECVCPLDPEADRIAALAVPAARRHSQGSSAATPCALALGVDTLAGLDATAARHLIHRVRLYISPRLLLVARADSALDDEAFRALGFIRETVDVGTGVRIQSYDLATYKPTPDWLNARYWAHPDRWEP